MKTWRQILRAFGFFGIYLGAQLTISNAFSLVCTIKETMRLRARGITDYETLYNAGMAATQEKMGLIYLVFSVLAFAVFLIIFMARKVNPLQQVDARKVSVPMLLISLVGGLGATLFFNNGLGLLPIPESAWDAINSQQSVMMNTGLIPDILLYAILVPLLEEVVFRGLIYGRLRRGMPMIVATLVTSAIFGICHGSPLWMLYAFFIGLVMNYARIMSGSILASFMVHFAINLVGVLTMYGVAMPTEPAGMILFTVIGAVLLAAFVFVAYFLQKKEGNIQKENERLAEEYAEETRKREERKNRNRNMVVI
jgi:membrane protease YdiL (CAAX protease family)